MPTLAVASRRLVGTPQTITEQWPDPSPLPPRPQGAAARGKIRPAPATGFAGSGSRGEPDPGHFASPQSEAGTSGLSVATVTPMTLVVRHA